MPRKSLPRFRRPPLHWLVVLCLVILGGAYLITSNRWSIGRRAVEIADPSVRAWATREVSRLSGGSYLLTLSTIQVDEARRRVAIDTIVITTDSAVNARQKTPLPHLALRFRNCALEGVDLDQLAAGRGLHVTRVGCDSVAVMVDVPAAVTGAAANPDTTGRSFLNLDQRLDLPRSLPVIAMDAISFPQLRLVLSIATTSGRRTNLTLDRLGVQFDSLEYERKGHSTGDRVLLSRDVRVVLERFEGSREATSHLALRLLSANLARGTLRLDSLHYKPLAGGFADSLGLTELRVGHLGLEGIDWRRFLTTGDVQVRTLTLDTAVVRLPHHVAARANQVIGSDTPPLETTLRALDRSIRLDSLTAQHLVFINDGATPRDSSSTSVGHLHATALRFDNDSTSWAGAFPIGRVMLAAEAIVHRAGGERFTADSVRVDVPTGSVTAIGVHKGPEGDEAAFFRRLRYRRDRLSLAVARVDFVGVDLVAFLRKGDQHVRRADFQGFSLDVLSDKRLPASPAGAPPRRTPQQALRGQGLSLSADTIVVQGAVTYREQSADTIAPGVLSMRDLKATITGLRADKGEIPADAPPLHLVADTRFMDAGNLHFDMVLPLQAPTFQMRFRGVLSAMPADALNPFIGNALGMRFSAGAIESIRFDAAVDKGHATGTMSPRWNGLKVDLPGIARGSGGLFGGIRRAVAKFAANSFVIRNDNTGPDAHDGPIDHQWTKDETLPKFLWISLREALLPLLKR